jgi:class 3 adenylate cyclase
VALPNLETRAADLRAVLDAAGSTSTVLGGWFEALAPGVLLAASDPERVRALVWWNPTPRTIWAPDFPWGWGPDQVARELEDLKHWGTVEYGEAWADQFAREGNARPPDEEARVMAKRSRQTCTPDVALELARIWWDTDIRAVLPTVRVPTLLMADEGETRDREVTAYVAGLMSSAETVLVPDEDGWPIGGRDAALRYARPPIEAIQRFIGIEPPRLAIDTVLSTVLFTDIVDSTDHQARLGDRAWKDLVERHHATVRSALSEWRGVEIDTAGDGFFASFDGPARAIHCALEVSERVRGLGIETRAGVHTGECEVINGKIGGLSVSIGARVAANAEASQVLVSQTVKDLVAGSGFAFEDRGEHELKGVPNHWRLYAVTN